MNHYLKKWRSLQTCCSRNVFVLIFLIVSFSGFSCFVLSLFDFKLWGIVKQFRKWMALFSWLSRCHYMMTTKEEGTYFKSLKANLRYAITKGLSMYAHIIRKNVSLRVYIFAEWHSKVKKSWLWKFRLVRQSSVKILYKT